MNQDIVLQLDNTSDLNLVIHDDSDLQLTVHDPIPQVWEKNYELLENKPQFEGITIMGNLTLADFFPDGFVIDGGNAFSFSNQEEVTI